MTSFAETLVMVNVTEVVEMAPVCVTVVGVVTSRAKHTYPVVVAPSVKVTLDAPVLPVQVKLPAIGPLVDLVLVVAHAPVPLAIVNTVPETLMIGPCSESEVVNTPVVNLPDDGVVAPIAPGEGKVTLLGSAVAHAGAVVVPCEMKMLPVATSATDATTPEALLVSVPLVVNVVKAVAPLEFKVVKCAGSGVVPPTVTPSIVPVLLELMTTASEPPPTMTCPVVVPAPILVASVLAL